MEYKNNCYGFVQSALEGNSEEDCYCDIFNIDLGNKIATGFLNSREEVREKIEESIFSLLEEREKFFIFEFLKSPYQKDSQHVAILDNTFQFSHQDGPDGEIYINQKFDILFDKYSDILGCKYYNVYLIKNKYQKNVKNFLSDFMY